MFVKLVEIRFWRWLQNYFYSLRCLMYLLNQILMSMYNSQWSYSGNRALSLPRVTHQYLSIHHNTCKEALWRYLLITVTSWKYFIWLQSQFYMAFLLFVVVFGHIYRKVVSTSWPNGHNSGHGGVLHVISSSSYQNLSLRQEIKKIPIPNFHLFLQFTQT